MTAPQGIITFTGIDHILSGVVTLTHGTQPSTSVLTIPPLDRWSPRVGALQLQYGPTRITLPDCIVDRVGVQHDQSGRLTWTVYILDRRWKWQFAGRISGYYNVRRGGGDTIVEGTEKTPKELAKLCLEAMGETRYNLDQMPNDVYPEIEWDYALPAEALARLCDQVGCRVVLRLDNSVAVVRTGVGVKLPIDATLLSGGVELNYPERPDELVVVAAPTRWQRNFILRAVGKEPDGEIKPISELSYAPDDGWKHADIPHFNCVEDVKHRELAKETVYRWYRIEPGFTLPGGGKVTDLDRILPIHDKQIETMTVEGREEPRPAWVYGVWESGMESAQPFTETVEDDITNKPQGLYTRPFRIERELGIVIFAEPVVRRVKAEGTKEGAKGGELREPLLRLRVAVSLRDEKTRGWIRKEFSRRVPGAPRQSRPRYIRQDDVDYHYIDHRDNLSEARRQANYYLDAAMREYTLDTPASATYAGFRLINLDGAIQQVAWAVSEAGFATTRASRNAETLEQTIPYEQSRFYQRLSEELRSRAATSRQRQETLERGRA